MPQTVLNRFDINLKHIRHEASGSIVVLPLHEGLQLFSRTKLQHGLAVVTCPPKPPAL